MSQFQNTTMQRLFPERIVSDNNKWHELLKKQGIRETQNLDIIYGIFDEEILIATGARYQNIIKCVAIDEMYQGGSIFNTLVSILMNEIFQQGFNACYVYTKKSAIRAFSFLGFAEIGHVDDQLYFLENAQYGLPHYLKNLQSHKIEASRVAAIVMNANPFTNGHLYLVEKASKENEVVHLFVLSEDLSHFKADIRLALVRAGVAHLENVHIHTTGDYLVSSATFPSYFLPEETDLTKVHARLDAIVFKQHIAPVLAITHRYVGSEPLSPTTHLYNQALQRELSGKPELVIVQRKCKDKECISASRVRKLLMEKHWDAIRELVPETTYQYLAKGKLTALPTKTKINPIKTK